MDGVPQTKVIPCLRDFPFYDSFRLFRPLRISQIYLDRLKGRSFDRPFVRRDRGNNGGFNTGKLP